MLIPLYCETSPGWYDLPGEGVPDRVWIAGGVEPSTRHADLHRYLPMDMGHDFRIEGGRIRYMYSGGDQCWILLQYGEVERHNCPSCGDSISVEAHFCPSCGAKL